MRDRLSLIKTGDFGGIIIEDKDDDDDDDDVLNVDVDDDECILLKSVIIFLQEVDAIR